jgi:hypothetical protein
MNKTVSEHLNTFLKWFFVSLLTVSGLANLVFWIYIGKAFWYHQSSYLWVALWWLVATIPNGIAKFYAYKNSKGKIW